jgi:hypothetical protein
MKLEYKGSLKTEGVVRFSSINSIENERLQTDYNKPLKKIIDPKIKNLNKKGTID